MELTVDWSLQALLDPEHAGGRSLAGLCRAAIAGGATIVQLRDKLGSTRQMLQRGESLLALTRVAGIPLIVNDRVDVALAIGADGVHLGQEDLPLPLARRLLGPDRLVGVSTATVAEARQAEADGADYLGVGDIFGTRSKADADRPIGLEGLAEIVRAVSIPVVAIGGITLANAAEPVRAGAAGIAVISAILGQEDVEGAARRLRGQVRQAARERIRAL